MCADKLDHLTLLSGSWFAIPERIVRLYGIGNIQNTEIVLIKEGCNAIKQMEVNFISQEEEDNSCKIIHCKILSRIGETYYIETDTKRRFSISKEFVQTYSPSIGEIYIRAELTEIKNIKGKYLESEVRLSRIRLEEMEDISLIVQAYNKEGKLIDTDFIKKKFTSNSKNDDKDEKGNSLGYAIIPISIKEKEDVAWTNLILTKEGKKLPLIIKRNLIIR